MKKYLLTSLTLGLLAFGVAAKDVDFHTQVAPILMKHCYECHGGDQAKGGFSMNTRRLWLDKKAAKPGDAAGSLTTELLNEEDPEVAMPPKGPSPLRPYPGTHTKRPSSSATCGTRTGAKARPPASPTWRHA